MNEREIAMNILIKLIETGVFKPLYTDNVVDSVCEAYGKILKTVQGPGSKLREALRDLE